MKNYNNIFSKINVSALTFSFLFSLVTLFSSEVLKAQQVESKIESTPLFENKTELFKNYFSANASIANVEGNFIIKDGYLDDVKGFVLSIPLSAVNEIFSNNSPKENLDFKLTHVMVLPQMGLVHIVGDLEIAGTIKRTELDFNFKLNEDQSITLIGTKVIKLSDYKKDLISNSLMVKNKKEINLDLNLVLNKRNDNFFAAN